MTGSPEHSDSAAVATRETKPGYHPPADAPHHLRQTDRDPRAAKRAERQVAIMFALSMLLAVTAIVAFLVIPGDETIRIPVIGNPNALNLALGVTIGSAILLIGVGAIHWAKKLMTDVEVVQERHPIGSDTEDNAEALAVFDAGTEQSGFARFTIIRRTLIGAMALLPLPFIVLLRDLWPTPEGSPSPTELLSTTLWRTGERIYSDITYQPIKAADIPVGGLVNAVPKDLPEVEEEAGNLNARAKAAIIVIRMRPEEIVSEQGDGWSYEGILAFSKICTHVGCPISLYEQRTHHLLCPCHQSTFDLADSGNVVFGPAARRMPQLPIGIDDEGYLIALSDFTEPVGPSFWEREKGNA
jgi:ubiquinol-cytochrome c reductase iron-sulfur subunit